jgi:hypothetical protein
MPEFHVRPARYVVCFFVRTVRGYRKGPVALGRVIKHDWETNVLIIWLARGNHIKPHPNPCFNRPILFSTGILSSVLHPTSYPKMLSIQSPIELGIRSMQSSQKGIKRNISI